jgi:hypothetical protein
VNQNHSEEYEDSGHPSFRRLLSPERGDEKASPYLINDLLVNNLTFHKQSLSEEFLHNPSSRKFNLEEIMRA